MKSVQDLAEEIIVREGDKFTDDPDDPGGATKYGVTVGTMRALGLDLNRDGRVDARDVQTLPKEQAIQIFIDEYYYRPKINTLPECVQPQVFDMQVNSGINAVKLLQRLLTKLGYPCEVDGQIGPATARAAELAAGRLGEDLGDAYAIARRDWYYNLADTRPASRKYARRQDGGKGGWIIRAEEFMRPEKRLTEAQHRSRVAGWQ